MKNYFYYSKVTLEDYRTAICFESNSEFKTRLIEFKEKLDTINSKVAVQSLKESFINFIRPKSGWSIGYLDAEKFYKTYFSLSIKEDYKICIFKWYDSIGGNGIPYCLPKKSSETDVLSKWILKNKGKPESQYQKPDNALDNLMEAINGDETPLSYLSASIFYREVNELGAFWHGISWGSHHYIDQENDIKHLNDLTWIETKPKDFRPVVYENDENFIVTFYTFTGLLREAIYQHQDIYEKGSYLLDTNTKTVAEGSGGYIY